MQAIRDDVVGVPLRTAAVVIGVTSARLAGWAERQLIVPSVHRMSGTRRIWSYSFTDLVEGRVVRQLEDRGVHIAQIMTIVQASRDVADRPLAELRWAVDGREAFVQFPDDSWFGGRRPLQAVMPEVLDLDAIRQDTRQRLQRPRELAGHMERRRGVMHSHEVFAGTRVPVETIRRYIEAGFDDQRILSSFPTLLLDDLVAVRRAAG